jgi:hypothetical protein
MEESSSEGDRMNQYQEGTDPVAWKRTSQLLVERELRNAKIGARETTNQEEEENLIDYSASPRNDEASGRQFTPRYDSWELASEINIDSDVQRTNNNNTFTWSGPSGVLLGCTGQRPVGRLRIGASQGVC